MAMIVEPYSRSTIGPATYRAYMFRIRWSENGAIGPGSWSSVTVHSRQISPAATPPLSRMSASTIADPFDRQHRRERDRDRQPEDRVRREGRTLPRPRAK